MSDELPDGWALSSLDTLCVPSAPICYGVLKPGVADPNGIPMFRVKDIRDGRIDLSDVLRITPELDDEFERSRVVAQDVLVSVQGSVGRVGVVPAGLKAANISRTLARIRCPSPELASWVALALRAPDAQREMQERMGGTTRDSLNIRDLREIRVPVAPLPERRRIVAKVEALLTKTSAARERLEQVSGLMKRFRQSILAAACFGRLTEEWRVKSRNGIELARSSSGDEGAVALPSSWKWERIGDVFRVETGTTPPKNDPGNYTDDNVRGCPFFKPTDLDAGADVRVAREWLTAKGEQASRVLPPLTVCVTSIGATIGKTGLLRVRGATNQQINSLVPASAVLPEFAYFFCCSSYFQRRVLEESSSTTLPIINKSRFESLEFPVAPKAEQQEIVRRVEDLLRLAHSVERRWAQASARTDKLSRAILQKAFKGDLLPQDPNDEPASVMLAAMKEEVNMNTRKGTSRRRPRRPPANSTGAKPGALGELLISSDANGVTPEELFGRAGYRANEPDDVARFYRELREAVQKGALREVRTADGASRILPSP